LARPLEEKNHSVKGQNPPCVPLIIDKGITLEEEGEIRREADDKGKGK
jgi:hypothetical protein